MHKKWTFWDVVILILEVISPLISVIITCFVPIGQSLDSDKRLAILGAGISIPVVLLQISITQGNNKVGNDMQTINKELQNVNSQINELSEKLNHISPIMEKVFISDNERVKRFAYRRFKEVCKTIQTSINNNNSGNLRPNEYYQELLHLADLIINDKAAYKDKFAGEIWAMTGFAEEEWIADEGYERLWTERLKTLAKEQKIKTRRLCLLPDSVYGAITKKPFADPPISERSYWGFIKFLESYYKDEEIKRTTEHFVIRENDNLELKRIKGFFAIKLTNGELHILCGETVDSNGALTAQVLFDPNEILEVRRLFELYAVPIYKLETKLKDIVNENGFIEYINKLGIAI